MHLGVNLRYAQVKAMNANLKEFDTSNEFEKDFSQNEDNTNGSSLNHLTLPDDDGE